MSSYQWFTWHAFIPPSLSAFQPQLRPSFTISGLPPLLLNAFSTVVFSDHPSDFWMHVFIDLYVCICECVRTSVYVCHYVYAELTEVKRGVRPPLQKLQIVVSCHVGSGPRERNAPNSLSHTLLLNLKKLSSVFNLRSFTLKSSSFPLDTESCM